ESSVVEELSIHLEDHYRDLLARGVPEDEARRRALAELDDGDDLERRLRRVLPGPSLPVPPTTRARHWLAGVPGDLRYATRTLLRERGFTVVALLTLALGIGAVTAMFSLVHGLLLRQLPYPHGDRLATVVAPGMILPGNLEQWREGAPSLERLAGFNLSDGMLNEPRNVRRLLAMVVTDDLLPLLGAQPIRGRIWSPGEVGAGDARVMLISERLWTEVLLGEDPTSRTLTIDGIPHVILGVLPEEFHSLGYGVDAWVPLAQHRVPSLQGVARLRTDATAERAQAELSAVGERVEALPIAEEFGRLVRLQMQRDVFTGDSRPALLLLFAASGCVLLLACANLANLLLSRAAGRGRELAIRSALGAGRGALLRQLLVEHACLAIAGGVLGLLLAWSMLRVLVPLLPPGFVRLPAEAIRIDIVVLAATFAAAMLAMALAGLAPTFASMRSAAPMAVMARGTPARFTRRWRETLIAAETAIAVILLVGTALLVRTYLTLRPSSPGYETSDRVVARLHLPDDPVRNVELVRRLIRDIELASPGVRAAASYEVPLSGMIAAGRVHAVDGDPVEVPPGTRPPQLHVNSVSPEYIRVLGVTITRGRAIAETDSPGAEPIIVLNERAARQFWPELDDPVGRRLTVDLIGGARELVVVGVFGDIRTSGNSTSSRPQGLLSYEQAPWSRLRVIVHVPPGSSFDAGTLREAVERIDPTVPVGEITTLAAIASRAVATPRYQMAMMSGFGVLALLLAVIGCYGVLAYSVAQRTREFGVRMALGAAPRAIQNAVMGRAGLLVMVGLVVGGAGSMAIVGVIQSSFFGVIPVDPATSALVAIALLAISMVAAWLPARRAAAVDPVVALREE
ncbi:MAG TPA: ABC transporter permease, partial [Gemmatimonadaceae bacterium]|nr:ABC transporter permease [Gemmatimonadaceae bacterium]